MSTVPQSCLEVRVKKLVTEHVAETIIADASIFCPEGEGHGAHAFARGRKVFGFRSRSPQQGSPEVQQSVAGRRAVVDDIDVGGVLTVGSGMDQVEARPGDVLDMDPAEHLVGFDDATGSAFPKAVED